MSIMQEKAERIATRQGVNVIAKHYLIAALWADCPEGTHPKATKQAATFARARAQQFICALGQETYSRIVAQWANGYGNHDDCGPVLPWRAAMGHDLYLTTQGHGAGFQDRESLPNDLRDFIVNLLACDEFSAADVAFYRGWMYIR